MKLNENRSLVIEKSVQLEGIISIYLTLSLNLIPDQSISFGFTSQSLSFNSKINLLIDLKSVSQQNKKKFTYFMQIRNQFAHNPQITDFTNCFDRCDNMTNCLNKLYAKQEGYKFITNESERKLAFNFLYEDLKTLVNNIIDIWQYRTKEIIYLRELEVYYKSLKRTIKEFTTTNNNDIFQKIMKSYKKRQNKF
jgi:hypothetical protein